MVNIPIPGGASNALIDSTTMYVVGQQPQTVRRQTLFGGNLTVVNLANNTAGSPVAISDGQPGAMSRMIEADDNTLWIAMTGLHHWRALRNQSCQRLRLPDDVQHVHEKGRRCWSPTSATLPALPRLRACTRSTRPRVGRCTSTPLPTAHRSTTNIVTVTGTAYDVAYMDAITDTNNTVY